MGSRIRESHHPTSLFVLTVLAILSSASFWKAQKINEDVLAFTRSSTSQTTCVDSSLTSGKSAQARNDGPVIVNTDLVTLIVSVTDGSDHCIAGLDRSAFTIFDGKIPQEISFFSDADAPISIAIVLDVSGSMSGEKIRQAREAVVRFMKTSLDADEYFLIVFNQQPQLLLEGTRDSKAVLDKLSAAEPQGSTALFDACYVAVERLSRGAYSKRVLLLISDGQDNNSRYGLSETRQLLRESEVMVYSIGIADPIQLTGKAGARIRHTLEGLAEITGGKAFYPRHAEKMDETFEEIALELRSQYSIGYRPRDFTSDGKWHRIKVKVSPPSGTNHLSVRSRAGYYAIRDLGGKRP